MKFKMSHNIAIQTKSSPEAINFYSNILGFTPTLRKDDYVELDAEPLKMFIEEDNQVNGLIMELFVEDLDLAKEYLLKNGCKIIRWNGVKQDCFIEDPFGLRFNIWEEKF